MDVSFTYATHLHDVLRIEKLSGLAKINSHPG